MHDEVCAGTSLRNDQILWSMEVEASSVEEAAFQPNNGLCNDWKALFYAGVMKPWCREGESNPHEVALGGF